MPHRKPYPEDDDRRICDGGGTTRHLVLGTDFITDVALFSMQVSEPLRLKPGHSSTNVALRTLSEALAKAACGMLDIEPGELMAEFRPALTPAGMLGSEAEIFLYDTLPGGAGFAPQIADRGLDLFRSAWNLLKTCAEDCDASCYRCLRSFKNKFEHGLLDRHIGAELIEYLLDGDLPGFNPARLRSSTRLLANDLQRHLQTGWTCEVDAPFDGPSGRVVAPILLTDPLGMAHVVALSGPLTDGQPTDPAIARLLESGRTVHVENELVVRRNLPHATRDVLQKVL